MPTCVSRNEAYQLLQRVRLGSTQLVTPAEGLSVFQRIGKGLCDITDVHRRQTCVRAGQGQGARDVHQGGEAIEEAVIRAEDHRGSETGDRHAGLPERVRAVLAFALAAKIVTAASALVSIQRTHVQ